MGKSFIPIVDLVVFIASPTMIDSIVLMSLLCVSVGMYVVSKINKKIGENGFFLRVALFAQHTSLMFLC